MQNFPQQSLAAIVSSNHHAAPVLERFHLDYCCKGKRSLEDACTENGIDINEVIRELTADNYESKETPPPFTEMSANQLTEYIVSVHHAYVKHAMPLLQFHLEKVAFKHGEHFPYMREVARLFAEVKDELTSHMEKEEIILFPRINELEESIHSNHHAKVSSHFVQAPITVMEDEHERAGNILDKIRELTQNYTAPAGACNTFKLSLAELEEFETDLHKHVHLENHILFPKALQMTI